MTPRRHLLLSVLALVLAAPVHAATTYVADPAKSTLAFVFKQAGADSEGKFRKFDVRFAPPEGGAGALEVVVDIGSLDTQDKERDQILRTEDLFDVAKHPQARFVATKITPAGNGRYEAQGRLTIRGATREVRIPLTFRASGSGGELSGETTIRRLDFGVGQGEWKSTEWVGNDVKVKFALRMVPAAS